MRVVGSDLLFQSAHSVLFCRLGVKTLIKIFTVLQPEFVVDLHGNGKVIRCRWQLAQPRQIQKFAGIHIQIGRAVRNVLGKHLLVFSLVGKDNKWLCQRRMNKVDIKDRVSCIPNMIKLTSLADRYPTQMSGG